MSEYKRDCFAILLALFCISFSLVACNVSNEKVIESDAENSGLYQFIQNIDEFPYVAHNKRKDQILSNITMVEIGMTCDEVRKMLGKPDYITYTGNVDNSGLPSKFWAYYLVRNGIEVNMQLDKAIFLYLDSDCHLVRIEKVNLD